MKCYQPTKAEMKGLNRIEKKLMTLEHAALVGMLEETMNQLADILKVRRKVVWRLLFEEIERGKD